MLHYTFVFLPGRVFNRLYVTCRGGRVFRFFLTRMRSSAAVGGDALHDFVYRMAGSAGAGAEGVPGRSIKTGALSGAGACKYAQYCPFLHVPFLRLP